WTLRARQSSALPAQLSCLDVCFFAAAIVLCLLGCEFEPRLERLEALFEGGEELVRETRLAELVLDGAACRLDFVDQLPELVVELWVGRGAPGRGGHAIAGRPAVGARGAHVCHGRRHPGV